MTESTTPQGTLGDAIRARFEDNGAFHRHLEENTRPDVVAELEKKIEESGVEFIYYMVPTIGGRTVAKVVPAVHAARNLKKGIAFHRTALTDLQTDRHTGRLIGGGVEANEFWGLPHPETFLPLAWDKSLARMFCTAYEPPHFKEKGGRVMPLDTRALMRITHEEFTKRHGLEMRSGLEPEMTWRGPMADVQVKDGASPAYQVENLERMRPVYKQVIRYAQEMGFDMIEGDYEDDGQVELNWNYDHSDLTVDRMITYRQIAKQVAREQEIECSFMPKPTNGKMGNGCHHNISLWRGDENTIEEDGKVELHVTDLAKNAIAGILYHAPGMSLIMNSNVNSYKRFWDAGQFAPGDISWALDGRGATIRVSANGRLEFRQPDASVNPYLSHAYLLAAIDDGITRNLDAGESLGTESDFAGKTLPLTLGDAVKEFEADEYLQDTFPDLFNSILVELKNDEWGRYCSTLSQWEFDQYWEAIP